MKEFLVEIVKISFSGITCGSSILGWQECSLSHFMQVIFCRQHLMVCESAVFGTYFRFVNVHQNSTMLIPQNLEGKCCSASMLTETVPLGDVLLYFRNCFPS